MRPAEHIHESTLDRRYRMSTGMIVRLFQPRRGQWLATAALSVLVAALVAGIGGCTRFTPRSPFHETATSRRADIGHPFDHIVIVVLENASYEAAMQEPYLRALTMQGRLLSNFHAVAHPSYPNYLAMITGRRIQTSGDKLEIVHAPSIAASLEARGLTWGQFAEGMPRPCFRSDSALYRQKHVPFLSIAAVVDSPARCARAVPASTFDPTNLPSYAFYTPDMRDDGHDTDVHFAARWLRGFFQHVLVSGKLPARTVIVVTFDESEEFPIGKQPNHIYTVLLGSAVAPGGAIATYYDHFDMLRTIEENFGLAPLAAADSAARPISGVWLQ